MDFNSVVMNPEILSLKVSEQVRAEVFSANIFIRSGIFVIAGEYTKNTAVHFSKNILSI